MDKALPPPLRARYRVPTARVDSLGRDCTAPKTGGAGVSRKVCPPCCSACGGHVWEGEPFASKSPGNRTGPPAVTPYRPYSRCGTNLIECAESARGRRAERGEVSCQRTVCRGVSVRGDTRNECVSVRANDGAHGLTSRGWEAHGLVELRSPPGTRPRRDAGVWVDGDVW